MEHTHPNHPHSSRSSQTNHDHMSIQHAGHEDHAGMIDDYRKRFWTTLLITIPVIALSPMIQHWFHYEFSFKGSGYFLFGLSSIVFFYGGFPFLSGFFDEIKKSSIGMMTLIAVAITSAYAYSTATVFGLQGADFFWELCTLILIMLLGHWLEMKSVAGTSRELELLVQLLPSNAHLMHSDHIMDISAASLKEGDLIIIRPGESIPADGVITEGESFLNESMLTGESIPVKKSKDQTVIAGALNGNGAITVRVSHSSKDSYLSRVIRLVEDAQKTRSKTQLLADKAARILTYIALFSGFTTFFVWLLVEHQSVVFALERMVTVIVICCPHALGLAVPLVVAISTSISAKNGLLIKNRTAFENARKITMLIFDKTGTLTEGRFQVVNYQSFDPSMPSDKMIAFVAALEKGSEHPIGSGIVAKARELDLQLPTAENVQAVSGKGIEGIVEGIRMTVASPQYAAEKSPADSKLLNQNNIDTIVYLLMNDSVVGSVSLADRIRPESYDAIRTLHENNIKSILLSGDNAQVAEKVSRELKMDGFFAEVLPHQKLEKIRELQLQGEFVAMTGDGVNDAPALAQADIGIAVGSGSDIAAETAGIILVNSNPRDITRLILFGKATYRKMIQNLIWATGYNVIALPLAAGILYNYEVVLDPAAGAVLMSVSTILVAINAKLLKYKGE